MTDLMPNTQLKGGASCPALMVAAPASNQGKTTITAAIARYHRNAGRKVRVFKIGPDFIDPMILERASGTPTEQLDMWMVGETASQKILAEAAEDADLILLEGVMGLFDGTPSSADLAKFFGIPILLVIDASAMAQSFGAIVHGFTTYDPDLSFGGVLANRVGSERHADILLETVKQGTPYMGHVLRDEKASLPDRHLGLVQAMEIDDLEIRIEKMAEKISQTKLVDLPESVEFSFPEPTVVPKLLEGKTIAVAKDTAFSFIYQANVRCLEEMGAKVIEFSPLTDTALPETNALYLPGGYPELHLKTLSQNTSMQDAIKSAHAEGMPILAECGGLLYLLNSLETSDEQKADMVGLIAGSGKLQKKLTALGLQSIETSVGELRGHTFHYSTLETSLEPITRATSNRTKKPGEAIYAQGNLVASYVHFYFPSCPEAVARIFAPNAEGELFS